MEKLKTVNEVLNSLQLKHIDTLNVSQISLLDLIYNTCKAIENLLSKLERPHPTDVGWGFYGLAPVKPR